MTDRKAWVEYVRIAYPGKRWWVVRRHLGTGATEGAIQTSKEFPRGSVYRSKRDAEAALQRFLKTSDKKNS